MGVEMHSKRLKRNYVEPIGPKMKVLMDLLRHTKRTGAVIVTHGAKSLNWALFEMCTVQCTVILPKHNKNDVTKATSRL